MSIINDALKKAQDNLGSNPQKDISKVYEKIYTPAQKPSKYDASSNGRDKQNIKKGPRSKKTVSILLFMTFVIILIVSIFAVTMFKYLLSNNNDKTSTKKKPQNTIQALSSVFTAVTKKTPPVSYKNSRPELSGIMMIGNKRVAVINNDVYSMGDTVGGMKITAIHPKTVELKKGAKTFMLDVRN